MEKNLISDCHLKPVIIIRGIPAIGVKEEVEKEIYICSECWQECDAYEKIGT